MIRLYKDIRITFYLAELIGTILLVLGTIYLYQKIHSTLLLIGCIILIIIYMIVVGLMCMKKVLDRLTKLSDILGGNKGLKEGIKEIEGLLKRVKNKEVKALLLNNLMGAYISMGNTKKAMKLCEKDPPEYDNSPMGKQNRIIYLNNICEISIRENLLPLAQQNLTIMKDLIEDKAFNKEQKKYMRQIYSDLIIEYMFKEDRIKEYESIAKYYEKRFKEEENIAGKVFFAHQLTLVYKKLKEKKKVKEYQEYYEQNKGDLNYS